MIEELRRWVVLALAAALAAVVVLGCGGGGGGATADQPLSKGEFVKQAERICSEGVAEKEKIFSAGLKSGKALKYASKAEIKEFVEAVASPYPKLVARLGRLRPPAGDKAARALVADYEKALRKLEADPFAATESNPFIKGDEAAAKYGLKACVL